MPSAPLLYIIAFGWGMGRGVTMDGVEYLAYMLPGLMALSSMSRSFGISSEINIARFYWHTFEEFQTAPVSPAAIALGEVLGGVVRGFLAVAVVICLALISGVGLNYGPGLVLGVFMNCFMFSSAAVWAAMVVRSHADQSNLTGFIITADVVSVRHVFQPGQTARLGGHGHRGPAADPRQPLYPGLGPGQAPALVVPGRDGGLWLRFLFNGRQTCAKGQHLTHGRLNETNLHHYHMFTILPWVCHSFISGRCAKRRNHNPQLRGYCRAKRAHDSRTSQPCPRRQGGQFISEHQRQTTRWPVFLDGMSIINTASAHKAVKWDLVALDDIDSLKIIKGGGAVAFGDNSSGGVIIIKSKAVDRTKANVSFEAGNQNYWRVRGNASRRAGPWGLALNGDFYSTDGFRRNGDKDQGRAGLKLSYAPENWIKWAGADSAAPTVAIDYGETRKGNPGLPQYPSPRARSTVTRPWALLSISRPGAGKTPPRSPAFKTTMKTLIPILKPPCAVGPSRRTCARPLPCPCWAKSAPASWFPTPKPRATRSSPWTSRPLAYSA